MKQPSWAQLLVIHGEGDGLVSPRNAWAAANLWAGNAGATQGRPRVIRRGKRHPMTVTEFSRGRAAQATLVLIEGLGHAWSGGAAAARFSDSQGPDASRMIWRFAARQFSRA